MKNSSDDNSSAKLSIAMEKIGKLSINLDDFILQNEIGVGSFEKVYKIKEKSR